MSKIEKKKIGCLKITRRTNEKDVIRHQIFKFWGLNHEQITELSLVIFGED